jgi:hypothetical protein
MLEGMERTRLEVLVRNTEAFLGAIAGVLRLHDLLRRHDNEAHPAPVGISTLPSPHHSGIASNDETVNTSSLEYKLSDAGGERISRQASKPIEIKRSSDSVRTPPSPHYSGTASIEGVVITGGDVPLSSDESEEGTSRLLIR